MSILMNVLNILIHEVHRYFDKIALKRLKSENFVNFLIFGVNFGSIWGLWGQFKSP